MVGREREREREKVKLRERKVQGGEKIGILHPVSSPQYLAHRERYVKGDSWIKGQRMEKMETERKVQGEEKISILFSVSFHLTHRERYVQKGSKRERVRER